MWRPLQSTAGYQRHWGCSRPVSPKALEARSNVAERRKRPSTETLRAPERQRLYEQLAARLLDYVEITGLTEGDRLPSERDLAQALHVSRASVRQATVALEVRGTLEVRHGDGIYLRARSSSADNVGVLGDVVKALEKPPSVPPANAKQLPRSPAAAFARFPWRRHRRQEDPAGLPPGI